MKFREFISYGKKCDHPPRPDSPALEIEDLSFSYADQRNPALEDISVVVKPGEKVALVGPNGAGKSTLMKLVLGLEQQKSGSIRVFGHESSSCKHRVAMVPQKSSIDWSFPVSVRQVVTMGRYVHMGWFRRPSPEDRQAVESAMNAMKICDIAHKQVGELSGGQQQRVMLARTLAHDADLLLLDEPLNHVDIATQELMFHTLEELSAQGKSMIVSTHDLGILSVHFSRVLFLDRSIIADGGVKEVLTARNIARAYGFEFHGEKELTSWLNG